MFVQTHQIELLLFILIERKQMKSPLSTMMSTEKLYYLINLVSKKLANTNSHLIQLVCSTETMRAVFQDKTSR
jgi:hypothetical protein